MVRFVLPGYDLCQMGVDIVVGHDRVKRQQPAAGQHEKADAHGPEQRGIADRRLRFFWISGNGVRSQTDAKVPGSKASKALPAQQQIKQPEPQRTGYLELRAEHEAQREDKRQRKRVTHEALVQPVGQPAGAQEPDPPPPDGELRRRCPGQRKRCKRRVRRAAPRRSAARPGASRGRG